MGKITFFLFPLTLRLPHQQFQRLHREINRDDTQRDQKKKKSNHTLKKNN